jgi:signal transduction histidine kinase
MEPNSFPSARILVVEDEQIVALELKERLTRMGHTVLGTVGSGEEAIAQARRLRPDLLLMDVKLQGEVDGIQAAEAIRADAGADAAIVYLTAFADVETLSRAKLTEPYGYILKPFQERELHVVIDIALYRHRIERQQRLMTLVSGEVASSLSRQEIADRVGALVARQLAVWCLVHLRDADGALVLTASARPANGTTARSPEAGRPAAAAGAGSELESVAAAGRGRLFPDAARLVPGAPAAPAVVVPLPAGGLTLGTLTVASARPERPLIEQDVAFVEELGRRLAAGIDNARLYAEAQRAIRTREDILAIVSHDLKNPLSSVMMNAEQLLRHPDPGAPERVTRNARKIRAAAERISRLANDLLDMARLDSGRLTLELRRVNARELIDEALSMFDDAASQQAIHLSHEALPEVDLLCDRDRVLQVLSNLIGNALKFSGQGRSVAVQGRLDDGSLVFSVADQAGGISDEQRAHLFERFWQSPETMRKGTGLGLYIAKGLVQAHGGDIWFDTTPGAGSTFSFTIPLADRPGGERPPAT